MNLTSLRLLLLLLLLISLCSLFLSSFVSFSDTHSSVGYGDYVPQTNAGKVFTIFYVLAGVAFMAKTLVEVVKFPMLYRARRNELKVLNQFGVNLSKEHLEDIFNSHFFDLFPNMRRQKHELTKAEFSLLVLHIMNKVESKDLLIASRLFDSMDENNQGFLTQTEIDSNIQVTLSSLTFVEFSNGF